MSPGSRVEASDGVALYVERHTSRTGQGFPLLLSPGMCTTRENFREQVEPLTALGAEVVLWDYRGHGRSEAPHDPDAYSMEQVLDDLERVLDWAAPGRPWVLGGHSFGGLASLHVALAHPERVRALLLFGSGPGFKNPQAAAGWKAQTERTASFLETRGLEAFLAGKAARTAVGLEPELPAAKLAAEAILAQDVTGLAHFARRVAGLAPPVIDRLSEIRVPTLVLVGELDAPYLRAADVMADRIEGAEKVLLAGAGHIASIERSAAFNAAVSDFLKRLPAP